MRPTFNVTLAGLATVLAFYACKSSEPAPHPSDSGGESGEASTTGGKSGSPSGGTSSAGTSSAGTAGAGGTSDPGGAAGESGNGGSSGTATGGTDSTAGEGGEGGSGEPSGPENLGYLLGPETDDQMPLLVTASHRLTPFCMTTDQSIVGLLSDAGGNAFIQCFSGNLGQFDAQFAPGWKVGFSSQEAFGIGAALVAPGGLVIGGNLAGNAVVAKYDADGMELWRTPWSSTGNEAAMSLALASDGAIYASGPCTGQAPGNPASETGGKWIARYESTGEMSWLKQYGADVVQSGLFLDPSDNLYMAGATIFEKFDSEGTRLLKLDNMGLLLATSPERVMFPTYGKVVPTVDRTRFYTLTTGTRPMLVNLDLAGHPRWFRAGEPQRTAIIEPVEGVTWTGTYGAGFALIVSGDALYIAGYYANTYANGSTPRPAKNVAYIGRYDLRGNRIWFQEYTPEGSSFLNRGGGIAFDPDGDLLVAIEGSNLAAPYLFRVSAEDGTISQ